MEELRKEIDDLKKKFSCIENEDYKYCFNKVASILEDMNEKIEELVVNQESIEENIKFMDDDLSGIQDELFEEVSIEELNDIDDEYTEINCANCGKPIFIEQSALSNNNKIPCPYCNNNIKS